MAKLAFSKLKLQQNTSVTSIFHEVDDQQLMIEVKQYLPINEKLGLISRALSAAIDDNNFVNSVKLELFGNLEIIYAYTNLTFTEKQKEDPCKLYDLLDSSGLLNKIIGAIPAPEYEFVNTNLTEIAKAYYDYQASALGIITAIGEQNETVTAGIRKMLEDVNNPEAFATLKDVMEKLG